MQKPACGSMTHIILQGQLCDALQHPVYIMQAYGGVEAWLQSFITLIRDGG
jgi:hypothetical protein